MLAASLVASLVLSACAAGSGGGTPSPAATADSSTMPAPSVAPGATFDPGDLRILLVNTFGPRWYCDPDQFPLARPSFDEQATAVARFNEMQSEGVVFGAIVRQLGLFGATTFTDAQKLAIYREWKVLVTIPLESQGGGLYAFDYLAEPPPSGGSGTESTGTIDSSGRIQVASQGPGGPPNCPICLARGTRIATPSGAVPVEDVRLGQAVWTLDQLGHRVVGTVLALGSVPVPVGHALVHLVLADGRSVTASPGHPLADGRAIGSLEVGDRLQGSTVSNIQLLPDDGGWTYDIVVSGPTGTYLSDGIALQSTLGDEARLGNAATHVNESSLGR